MSEEDRDSPRQLYATTAEPGQVVELLEEMVRLKQRSRQLIEEHYRVVEALSRISQELAGPRQSQQPH